MINYIWPIALVILANCAYHICSKSAPEDTNAFLSLFITYSIAAISTFLIFIFQKGTSSFAAEFKKLNWTSFALGIAIIGLEFGWLMAYRAGWKVNTASLTANLTLALVLLFVGLIMFKEKITAQQIVGMLVCGVGLFLITK